MWTLKRALFPVIVLCLALAVGCKGKKDPPCKGEDCPQPCTGPDCPCEGPDCPEPCTGPDCPEPCTGPDCPTPCTGPDCPCEGPNCSILVEPFEGEKRPGKGSEHWGVRPGEDEGIFENSDGNISIPSGPSGENLHYMWLANTEQGYVSKYDTRTGREVARYLTIFPRQCAEGENPQNGCAQDNGLVAAGPATGPNAGGPLGTDGLQGLNPSRTAIDYAGDAWVGNRAVLADTLTGTKHASVTKIANVVARCRNGGEYTSADANNNGVIDNDEWFHPGNRPDRVAQWDWGNPDSYDDCVLFTTPACPDVVRNSPSPALEAAGVRALAVAPGASAAGDVWAGCWSDRSLVRFHGDTGHTRPEYRVQLDIRPYGAIADNEGRVWAAQKEGQMVRIDETTGQPVRQTHDFALQAVDTHQSSPEPVRSPPEGSDARTWCSAYGIGLDKDGRIWLGGRFTQGIAVCRYNPQTDSWWHWGISQPATNVSGVEFGLARGIAADTHGWVYISGNGGFPHNFTADPWSDTRSQLMVIDANLVDQGAGAGDIIVPIQADNGPNNPANQFSAYDAGPFETGGVTYGETGAVGVGIDLDGRAWMVNHTGTALRFVPDYAAGVVRFDLNTRTVAPPTAPPTPGLYTYSDFTGYQLRNYVSSGRFTRYLSACAPRETPVWHGMTWEGSTPPGSSIRVEIRFGETREELEAAATGPADIVSTERSIPFDANPARWISLTFYLNSDDNLTAPVLEDFAVYSACKFEHSLG